MIQLHKTSHFQLEDAFNRMKTNAQKPRDSNDLATSELGQAMNKLVRRKLKNGFDPLEANLRNAQGIEHRAVRQLVAVTGSKQGQLFGRWKMYTVFMRHLEAIQGANRLVEHMNYALLNNTVPLLQDSGVYEKKKNVFNRLALAYDNKLANAFNKLKENKEN